MVVCADAAEATFQTNDDCPCPLVQGANRSEYMTEPKPCCCADRASSTARPGATDSSMIACPMTAIPAA